MEKQPKDKWDFNYTHEEEIMFWALLSEIYFDNFDKINNITDLRKMYIDLWNDPNITAIKKRALKYFYLYKKKSIEKGSPVDLMFESRTYLTQSDVNFYEKNIVNPMSKLVLNRVVENGGNLDFVDNMLLHLGANCYYPI